MGSRKVTTTNNSSFFITKAINIFTERNLTMNKALFVTSDNPSPIFAKDIESRKEYLEKYVGKLYCPTPGCCAQLDYVELPYLKNGKIFRTHKGSEHDVSCPYSIIHQFANAPSFSSETFSQAISKEHVKSILKGLYQRNTGSLRSCSSATESGITRHRNKSISSSPITGYAIASLDPNAAPIIKGEREPSVHKRRSQDLIAEDNNRLRGVDGTVNSARINDNYIELYFATTDYPVTLLFYNTFRNKSEQSYELIKHLAHLLITTDLHILVCCLGVVEINNKQATIQIMSPDYITIEGLSIFRYMSLLNS